MKTEHILCPTDFSEASAHAVDLAIVIAGWYKAQITALHVLSSIIPATVHSSDFSDSYRAEQALERQARGHLCARRHRQDRVSSIGRLNRIDIIGVRGRTPLDMSLFGSTTNHVVRRARCPVLTLRGQEGG